jgi:hypothetical protein
MTVFTLRWYAFVKQSSDAVGQICKHVAPSISLKYCILPAMTMKYLKINIYIAICLLKNLALLTFMLRVLSPQ